MLWFFIILLIISPLLTSICNQINNQKNSFYNAVLLPFYIFSMITIPILMTRELSFLSFQIISYIIFSLCFIFYFWKIFHKWGQIRSSINGKLLLKPMLMTLSILISFIIILFSSTTNFDTTYYIMISTNFLNSIYSTNGLASDPTFLLYLTTPMYYAYAAFFSNDITAAYYSINAVIYSVLICSIIYEIVEFSKGKNYWFSYVFAFLAIIAVSFTKIVLKSSANLDLQMLTLVMVAINLLKYKKNEISCFTTFMPIIAMTFFSATALVLSLPLTIAIFIYLIAKYRDSKSALSIMLVIHNVILLLFIFVYHTIGWYNVLLYGSNALIFLYFYLFKKIKNKVYLCRANITKPILINVIFPLIILTVSIIYIMVFMQSNYFDINNVYYFIVIFVLIYLTNIFYKFNNTSNDYISCILFFSCVLVLVVIPYHYISQYLFVSESNWRVIYLFIGISDINIFIIFILLFVCLLNYSIIYDRFIEPVFLNKFFWSLVYSKITPNAVRLTLMNFGSIALIASSSFDTFSEKDAAFSISDIYYSKNKITYEDRKFVETIDFQNYNKSYIIDSPINEYLSGGVNITQLLTQTIDPKLGWNDPHIINYNGYLDGIKIWSKNNNQTYTVNEAFVSSAFINLFNNFTNSNIKYKSVTNYEIVSIDYIFITKEKKYYTDLSSFIKIAMNYKEIYNGEKISIYKI